MQNRAAKMVILGGVIVGAQLYHFHHYVMDEANLAIVREHMNRTRLLTYIYSGLDPKEAGSNWFALPKKVEKFYHDPTDRRAHEKRL